MATVHATGEVCSRSVLGVLFVFLSDAIPFSLCGNERVRPEAGRRDQISPEAVGRVPVNTSDQGFGPSNCLAGPEQTRVCK